MITDFFTSAHHNQQERSTFQEATSKQNKQAHIHFVTFNITTLDNGHRLHELARKLQNNNIHVAAIQGTCWHVTNTWEVGEYNIFHEGKQAGQKHKHTGVMLMIHKTLTQSRTVRTYSITQGRTMAVRISDRINDLTLGCRC